MQSIRYLAELVDDVAATDAQVARFSLWTAGSSLCVWGAPTDRPGPVGFVGEGLVLRVLGTDTLLCQSPDAALAVAVASVLQDHIIDRRGRGWPEVFQDGAFVDILHPEVIDDVPVWSGRSHRQRFGTLNTLPGFGIPTEAGGDPMRN